MRDPNSDGRYFITVRIADVNGDRKPDLVTADLGDDWSMTVFVNGGKGTFRRHFDFGRNDYTSQDVGQGSEAIALGDLNGDRRLDVVEARSDEVSVFVNAPGMCTVPDVCGARLAAARRLLAERHCSVGKVRVDKGGYRRLRLATTAERRSGPAQGREGDAVHREVTMKRLLLILSLVVVAGAASGAGVRSATTAVERAASNADGAIVFASNRDGNCDLYAVNADGTGLTQLTNEPFDAYNPLPSPDGRHILFEGGEGMTVMDADGSGRRAFARCSVSPRGVVLGLEASSSAPTTRRGSSSSTPSTERSTPLADAGSAPSWSPDGTTIAFVDENKLYVIPAAGGTRHRLGIRKLADTAAPAWSDDSQRLAYVSVESGDRYSLWTIRADGSGGRRLAQKVSEETPSWSPDGSRIAFIRYLPHDVAAVSTVRSDGSGLHDVASGLVYLSDPSWSADGQVLYELGRFQGSEETDVYAVSPTGRGGRALDASVPDRRDEHRRTVDHRLAPDRARSSFPRRCRCRSSGRSASPRPSSGWRRTEAALSRGSPWTSIPG